MMGLKLIVKGAPDVKLPDKLASIADILEMMTVL